MSIVRWILVLPIAFATAVAVMMLFTIVGGWGLDLIYDDVNLPAKPPLWLRIFSVPFTMAVGSSFVYVGALVAPHNRSATAVALAVLSLALSFVVLARNYIPGDIPDLVITMALPAAALLTSYEIHLRRRKWDT